MQKWWDTSYRDAPNLKVFLAGSHVSWMKEHTLSEHGPLQNRRTGQIEVLPLDFQHAAQFYLEFTASERVAAYGIWGGLPGFLRDIDSSLGLWDNVRQAVLDPNARLFAEPDWLRFTDLREDALYTSIIRTIAEGQHTPSDIATRVGRHSAAEIANPLRRLVDLGLIERRVPLTVTYAPRARPRYDVIDHFLAFWYRFIDRRRGMLRRRHDTLALRQIQPEFNAYIARQVFEGVCREWVWAAQAAGQLPPELLITAVGAWWRGAGGDQDEIDVVALRDGEAVLFGECKWSNSVMDVRDLAGMRKAIAAAQGDLNPLSNPWRVLFSLAGFSPVLIDLAAKPDERLILVTPARLYDLSATPA